MARYVLVRGWLECSFDDVSKIQSLIDSHWENHDDYVLSNMAADLYKLGWSLPKTPINWTSFIFYGADIQAPAVSFVKDCLSSIAKSNSELVGFFRIDYYEDGCVSNWVISDGMLVDKVEADTL